MKDKETVMTCNRLLVRSASIGAFLVAASFGAQSAQAQAKFKKKEIDVVGGRIQLGCGEVPGADAQLDLAVAQPLDALSVHELDERIEALREEIARIEAAKASKSASAAAAAAFFKT